MKVLVISHNPFTSYESMGKTLSGLFQKLAKDEVCQFYIYPTVPDLDNCNSFFRITDKEVLRSFWFRSIKGEVIEPDVNSHKLFLQESDRRLYTNKKNQGYFRLYLRDLMWKLSFWYSNRLKRWILHEKPTVIFAAVGLSKFIYDIVLKISKEFNLRVVTYICDDYFFSNPSKHLIEKLHFLGLRRKIKKLVKLSSETIFICDEMCEKYKSFFNIKGTTIMTPCSRFAPENNVPMLVKDFSYFGNVRLGRYENLCEIAECLETINSLNNKKTYLHIYSPENDKDILDAFSRYKSIQFHGFLSGENYENAFSNASCLVHCESFSRKNIELTKYSVSTKIPNMLSSGKIIFGYGPIEVASINYLKKHSAAILCTEKTNLLSNLRAIVSNTIDFSPIVSNAVRTAKEKHLPEKNGFMLREILERNSLS